MTKKVKKEAIDKPLAIRLGTQRRAELEAVSAELDVTLTTLVKWSIDGFLKYYDEANGRVLLPLDFKDLQKILKADAEEN